jgi:NAD(P)-dependent dehydrogenase (short-subunit alcohol dehydrogenase family)
MGELLKGKSAVVTGAGGGIGRAIALAMAGEGASVVVNDLGVALDGTGASTSPADETVAEINKRGGKAIANYDSVAEYESAARIIKACVDNFSRIDILVNAAGNIRKRMCFNMTPEDWDVVIKVHLYGTFFCSRHACVHMREQKWGRIIGVTSDAYRGTIGSVSYNVAKGGIVSLMRSMALELAKYSITCNCIAPGAATRMTVGEVPEGETTSDDLPPPPEFVVPGVIYLASDYGASINGVVLGSAGGKLSIYSVPDEVRSIYKDYKKDGPWTIEEMRRLIPRIIEPHCPPLKAPELDWG